MSLCLLMVYSCSKDSYIDNEKTKEFQTNDVTISTRSSSANECNNLIINGDFENIPDPNCLVDDLEGNSDSGWNAISNGCLPPWNCYYSTADLISSTWDWSYCPNFAKQHWNDYTFISNWIFFVAQWQVNDNQFYQSEGIYQDVQLFSDSDITYTLDLDYSSTKFRNPNQNDPNKPDYYKNYDLSIEIRFEDDPISQNCFEEKNFQSIFEFVYIIPDGFFYPEVFSLSRSFKLDSDVSKFVLQAANYNTEYPNRFEGVFVDNVCITCTSDLVDRIEATKISDCNYAFEAIVDPSLNVVNYQWDFGQGPSNIGNSSPIVRYDFGTPGSYKVSVTVTDDRGCCTTVDTYVYCGDPEPCDYLMCWAAGDDCDDMQGLDYVEGFTLIDANGNNRTEYFAQPIYTAGGYAAIYNQWQSILANNYGIPSSKFLTFHPAANCDRVPDLFALEQVDIIMVSFFGTKFKIFPGFTGYQSNEMFFHSPDCNFAFEPQGCN